MTISRAEVITSVERRRRWSQDEKERLVAASLEPGASVSEVARMAGLHVSQLFRWRKELCKHGGASIAPFVPVEIGPSAPPREVAEVPLTTTVARRRKSQGIIEIDLGSGHRIRVDGDVDGDALRRVLDALVRDDPGSDGRASVARDRLHGHAPGFSVVGTPSAGGAAQGPAQRSSVRVPRSPKRSCEGDLARWPGGMPVHQKTRERKVHLAIGCGRSSDDLTGADELSVVRNRLAQPSRSAATNAGRIAVLLFESAT